MGYYDAPTNTTEDVEMSVNKLAFIGGVLFGSRALNVEHSSSDYDYAVLHSNLDTLLENSKVDLQIAKLEDHFDCIPPYGKNYLIKSLKFNGDVVDLLILEHEEHLKIITRATEEVAANTKLLLKDKDIRVDLYKKALLNNGFVSNTWIRRMYTKLKG